MYQLLLGFVIRTTTYVSRLGLRVGQQAGDSYHGNYQEVELPIRRKSTNYDRYTLSAVYAKITPKPYNILIIIEARPRPWAPLSP